MTRNRINSFFTNKKNVIGAICGVAALALVATGIYRATTPVFPEYIDVLSSEILQEETPLAPTPVPKVTTKTTTSSSKKKVTLSKASTRTYTKNLGTKTSTKEESSDTATQKVVTQTTTQVKTTEKYTKGSKVKEVTTKTTKTIKTTTTQIQSATNKTVATNSKAEKVAPKEVNVREIAPKMDSRVLSAFETLGFKVIVDPSFNKGDGYFDSKKRTITLRTADTNIYHELGHFLAFLAGNVDNTTSFKNLYTSEGPNFKGTFRNYAKSSHNEFFAECTREYVLHANDLKGWCPNSYKAIEEAMDKLTASQVAMAQKKYGKIWAANS